MAQLRHSTARTWPVLAAGTDSFFVCAWGGGAPAAGGRTAGNLGRAFSTRSKGCWPARTTRESARAKKARQRRASACSGVHMTGVCPTRKTHLWQRRAQRLLVGVLLPKLRPAVLLLQVLPVLHRRELRCPVLRRRRLRLLLHPALLAAAARLTTAATACESVARRRPPERGGGGQGQAGSGAGEQGKSRAPTAARHSTRPSTVRIGAACRPGKQAPSLMSEHSSD